MQKKITIVGAGIFGSTLAERITSVFELPVTIIDKRPHSGGNCWSEIDDQTGVEYHKYGLHIFHTPDQKVWDYMSKFTQWNNYQHHVWANSKGRIYSLPFNLNTINSFYGRTFTPQEARDFIEQEAAKEGIEEPANLEEKAISLIGRPIYEAFIKGYTIKQWEKDPRELPAEIITRLPVRFNYDNRYFSDRYEGIPLNGFGSLFKNMNANPLIDLKLSTNWKDYKETVPEDSLVIYTGPIDEFFDFRLGDLEWRTVDFEAERHDVPDYQGTVIINYTDADIKYTRRMEFAHLHPERPSTGKTLLFYESSRKGGREVDPYYPIATARNLDLLNAYQREAAKLPNVVFGGRLGAYKYFDMDDSVAEALNLFESEDFQNKLLK